MFLLEVRSLQRDGNGDTQPNETMDKYDTLIRYGTQISNNTRMESGNFGDRVLTFCHAVW